MNPEPIYTALVAEGFDPGTVPPNQTRTHRAREHKIWQAKAEKKAAAKPAARGKRGAA